MSEDQEKAPQEGAAASGAASEAPASGASAQGAGAPADGQAAGGSAPTGEAPATGAPAADDARAAAIAAAKAKAAAMAAARAAGQGGEAQAPATPGAAPVEAAAGAPAADDARAAAIAAAKAKAAALAAARAQGGAAPGAGAAGAAPAAGAPAPAARPAPAPKAPPPPPPLDPALAPIRAFLEKTLTGVKFDDRTFRIIGIEVERDQLLDVAQKLRDMPETRCDYLACLSGVDYPDAIEVVYHLASTSTPAEVALRVRAPKAEGECHVESVTGLWAGANWHEREAFDLLGVRFDHHPDLRRILLPEGFAGGYPLRKDFKDAREQRERKVRVR